MRNSRSLSVTERSTGQPGLQRWKKRGGEEKGKYLGEGKELGRREGGIEEEKEGKKSALSYNAYLPLGCEKRGHSEGSLCSLAFTHCYCHAA